ncbi:MAG: hypothetical protein FJX77_01300 [Armatimonadetes bacterium]|nr:hypothetical protein [Armatimonadota bacterium]
MRRATLILAPLAALAAVAAVAGPGPQRADDLVVHEWGTLLAMQGSDGVTLDGMYHEEHGLPSFVHARSRDQLQLRHSRSKFETPVIYFYTPRPLEVQVQARFRQGIWTQWYPQAAVVSPGLATASTPPVLRDGLILWHARVTPPTGAAPPNLPATSEPALWNHSRAVDAAFVQTRPDPISQRFLGTERFLFYRGLGGGPLPLTWNTASNGSLTCPPDSPEGVGDVFVLRVERDRAGFRYFPGLPAGQTRKDVLPTTAALKPRGAFETEVGAALEARLTAAGLYPKEARAMVNTWRSSYFQAEGTRVLFLLPQSWTDRNVPLQVKPQPGRVVRVMVGRVEALSEERERLALQAVRDLSSPQSEVSARAFQFLREQGRYVEPVLRRVLSQTPDAATRLLCRRLLLTPFVSELRAATAPTQPGAAQEKPLYVQAQLAALLRQIGLVEEARREAQAVLPALQRMPEPPLADAESRHLLRAHARALDGAGQDAAAVPAYEKFVRFGAQVLRQGGQCTGCHRMFVENGPVSGEWFASWWAGRRYGELARSTGTLQKELRTHSASRSNSLASRLLTAYLLDADGRQAEARQEWRALARLGTASDRARTARAR